MSAEMAFSTLPKTWILDLDGTLVVHNGHKTPEGDRLLPGVKDFLDDLSPHDLVIIITSRPFELHEETEAFLQSRGVRYDRIIWGAPYGERILVNDMKPSGLKTAYAVNCARNEFAGLEYHEDALL